jgi:hypothetical protein
MLLDGHLKVGEFGVKTRSYDWKYRGAVLLYTSGRTQQSCVQAYNYAKGTDKHNLIIGVANLVDVRLLNDAEIRKMVCNFNNLTVREVKPDLSNVAVVPFPFGYFFSNIRRFDKPIPFSWPSGPVKPIMTDVRSGSRLRQQVLAAGINS